MLSTKDWVLMFNEVANIFPPSDKFIEKIIILWETGEKDEFESSFDMIASLARKKIMNMGEDDEKYRVICVQKDIKRVKQGIHNFTKLLIKELKKG